MEENSMAIDLGWARTGRAYAWLGAEGFLVGAGILLLLNLGVGAQSATTGVAQYANNTWLVVAGSAFLVLGMLALIPVGLTLRELLGRGVGPEMVATFFIAGSLLGVSSRLLLIPLRLSLGNLAGTRGVQPQALNNFLLTYSVIENATNWLLYGWFLLTGLALYHASRSAMQQGTLPRAWGWLGLVSASGCWLVVLLTLVIVVADVPAVALAGKLVMAVVGIVLIPVWLTWLGRELSVALKREQTATADGVPEGMGGRTRRVPRVPVRVPGWLLRVTGQPSLALKAQPSSQHPD
jgi:hypothetical protein